MTNSTINTRSFTLNHKKRTIEMTKKFYNAASRFGSDEYNDLQQVRRNWIVNS